MNDDIPIETTARDMGSQLVDVTAPALRSRKAEGLTPSQEALLIQRLIVRLKEALPDGAKYDLIRKSLKTQMELAVKANDEREMIRITRSVWNELTRLKIKVNLSQFLNEAMTENDPQKVMEVLQDIISVQKQELEKVLA